MVTYPPTGHALFKALVKAGFEMPKECVSATMAMEVEGILQMHYVCNITEDDLPKIAEAFKAMAGPDELVLIEEEKNR